MHKSRVRPHARPRRQRECGWGKHTDEEVEEEGEGGRGAGGREVERDRVEGVHRVALPGDDAVFVNNEGCRNPRSAQGGVGDCGSGVRCDGVGVSDSQKAGGDDVSALQSSVMT